MTNEEKIWNFLYNKTKNPVGTAAIMGNLFAESSLNPINATGNKKGLSNKEYTDQVDSNWKIDFDTDGVAYGIAQWRYHIRKLGLLNLAKNKNKSIGDLDLQLEYLWVELQSYKTVLNAVLSGKTIREVSDIVMLKYERPGNTSESAKEKRAKYAQKYYDKYASENKITLSKKTAAELMKQLSNFI